MKNVGWMLLALAALTGCGPKMVQQQPPPDYDGARARSERAQQSLDQQRGD